MSDVRAAATGLALIVVIAACSRDAGSSMSAASAVGVVPESADASEPPAAESASSIESPPPSASAHVITGLPAGAYVSAVATDGEVVVAAGHLRRGGRAGFWVADR